MANGNNNMVDTMSMEEASKQLSAQPNVVPTETEVGVMDNIVGGVQPTRTEPTYESQSSDVMDLITQAGNMEFEGSPFRQESTDLMKTIAGSQYESDYASDVQNVLDQIQGSQFEYSLEEDPLFQQASDVAQRQVFEEMGARGILPSSITADRLSTAIGELAPIYRDQAFQEFQGTQQDRFNLVSTLSALDNNQYGRYRDQVGDQYNLAQYYDNLATEDYDRFLTEVNQMYKTAEWINTLDVQAYNQYSDQLDRDYRTRVQDFNEAQAEIENERKRVDDAWTRVQEVGYVDNEAAIVLGVEPGTLSREARIMAQEKANALAIQAARQQDAIDLANLKYKQEQSLIAEKAKNDAINDPATVLQNATPDQLGNYNEIRESLLNAENVNTGGDPTAALQFMGQFDNLYEDENVIGPGLTNVLKLELQSLADQNQYGLPADSDFDVDATASTLFTRYGEGEDFDAEGAGQVMDTWFLSGQMTEREGQALARAIGESWQAPQSTTQPEIEPQDSAINMQPGTSPFGE